jgi:hypothetical protein
MAIVFTLDEQQYPSLKVTKLTRKFQVLDGPNAGRSMKGKVIRDIIGVYYNYEMTICNDGTDPVSYAQFYNVISSKKDSHICTFPYNSNTITQEMYITSGQDTLVRMAGAYGASANFWDEILLKFIAVDKYTDVLPL